MEPDSLFAGKRSQNLLAANNLKTCLLQTISTCLLQKSQPACCKNAAAEAGANKKCGISQAEAAAEAEAEAAADAALEGGG